MDIGNNGERVESCIHRMTAVVGYLVNDGTVPPVVYFHTSGPSIVTLTNQVIYVRCPVCWEKIMLENLPKWTPVSARLLTLLRQ